MGDGSVAVHDVVAICKGTLGSFTEVVVEMVRDDSLVTCLAIYTTLSLIWTVARLTHIWWTGPTGGRFPPDVAVSGLIVIIGQYLRDQCRERISACSSVDNISSTQTEKIARLRAYLGRAGDKESAVVNQTTEHSKNGLPGPSYRLSTVSETVNRGANLSEGPTVSYLPVPSAVLTDRVAEWVERSADSGLATVPSSLLNSSTGVTNYGDLPDGGSSHHEEESQGSTLCGTDTNGTSNACGTSDLDSPSGSLNSQVRFVNLLCNF